MGEGHGSSLVCHTDLASCCRQLDSGVEGGLGEWHYPNGLFVGLNRAEDHDHLYISRDQMAISLNHRGDTTNVPGGVYCCVVPTTRGQETMCANLGMHHLCLVYLAQHKMLGN